MNKLSINQSDGFSWFPSLHILFKSCWELDLAVCSQSNHLHLVFLLPWQLLGYRVGLSRLHPLPPLLAIKVNHVLRMDEQEVTSPTTWIDAHLL